MTIQSYQKFLDLLAEPTAIVSAAGNLVQWNAAFASYAGLDANQVAPALTELVINRPNQVQEYLRLCSRSHRNIPGGMQFAEGEGKVGPARVQGALLEQASESEPAYILLRILPRVQASTEFRLLTQRIDDLNREIARRRRAELELESQREWLQVTLSSIGDAVIATDDKGNLSFLNPVAERLVGWSLEEARGQALDDVFVIVNEDTRLPVESPVAKVIEHGTVQGLANHTLLLSRRGEEYAIEDAAAPIVTPDGAFIGVVLVFHDVGDRRMLEKQLHQRAEMLAERDLRKDEFLAMLAHELRNPLAPVSNAMHILLSERLPPHVKKEAVGVAQRQLQQITRLLDDLLDVSRVTLGKIQIKSEPTDLMAAISTAIESCAPSIREHGHEFQSDLPGHGILLSGDSARLIQIFSNLLNNADKYTPSGGNISLKVLEHDDGVTIAVEDTGIGIPQHMLSDIFELFSQVDDSMERTNGGLGIGLTLVKSLVERHGGNVQVHSDGPNLGSRFTVFFPRTVLLNTQSQIRN